MADDNPQDTPVDPTEGRPEATTTAETYHRHDPDPSGWEVAEAVTGRKNDTPMDDERDPKTYAVPNSTLAARAAERAKAAKKVPATDPAPSEEPAPAAPAKRAAKKAK